MKKKVFFGLLTVVVCLCFSVSVRADEVYEYKLEQDVYTRADGAFGELLEALPDEIKDELPSSEGEISFEEYDLRFFLNKIEKALKQGLAPATETLLLLLGTVIVASVTAAFSNTVASEGIKEILSFCSSLCIALTVTRAVETVFDTMKALLDTLSETMLLMVPAMEAIYVSAGNLTTAAVTSTGVNMMIALCESMLSKVVEPGVYVAFFLSVAGSVTKNGGICYMSRTFRGLLGAFITVSMALLSFVLALQSSGAAAADTFASRTIKFAICTYLPIVGGTVAESFSLLSSSLGVIKQGCGGIGIVAVVIAFLPPFALLVLNRVAIGLSGAFAAVLGCDRERELLEECKGICTLLIATGAGAAFIYIIALGIFCKTPVALG